MRSRGDLRSAPCRRRTRPGPERLRAARRGARLALGAGAALSLLVGACGSPSGPSTVVADGYRVSFEAHAQRDTTHEHVGGRTVTITTYVAARGDETDAVSSSIPPGLPGSGAGIDERLAEAVTGSASSLGGTLLSHQLISWLGHRAESAVIATTDRLVRERVLADGDRLDVLEGISRAAKPAFPGYEHLLATFRLTRMHR